MNSQVNANLQRIRNKLPDSVRIIAVVKHASGNQIREAVEAGLEIGFNTYQQMKEMNDICTGAGKHFIGRLQANKVRRVIECGACLIQSVDSFRLAGKINLACESLNIKQDILIQVKTDPNKQGILPGEIRQFEKHCTPLSCIRIRGLMTIPAINQQSAYPLMKSLFDAGSYDYLSMGMSGDYLEAVRHGANMVRIGSALFL